MSRHTSTSVIIPSACDDSTPEALRTRTDMLHRVLCSERANARYVVMQVEEIRKAGTWPTLLADEPRTWERYCSEVLGFPAEFIAAVEEGARILAARGCTDATVREAHAVGARALAADPKVTPSPAHGEIGNGRSRDDNIMSTPPQYGTSATYLVRRLKRDHPEIAQALARGEYPSARAAAIAAGIVRVPTPLDLLRRAWKNASEAERATFLSEVRNESAQPL